MSLKSKYNVGAMPNTHIPKVLPSHFKEFLGESYTNVCNPCMKAWQARNNGHMCPKHTKKELEAILSHCTLCSESVLKRIKNRKENRHVSRLKQLGVRNSEYITKDKVSTSKQKELVGKMLDTGEWAQRKLDRRQYNK